MAKKEFARKPYNSYLYKWQVVTDIAKGGGPNGAGVPFCNATPFSQGEDFIVTYVYNREVDSSGIAHQYAYVACDYVA